MRNGSKARYAVAALVDLALQQGRRPTALADIANRQGISVSYLEQLFARLRHAGLIRSVRGPGGGYVLTRSPRDISVGDVWQAVLTRGDAGAIPGSAAVRERTAVLWHLLDRETAKILQRITLQEVLDNDIGGLSDVAA